MPHFLRNFLNHDKRVEIISVYLAMLVLFTTSLKSYFPELTKSEDISGLNALAHQTALLYGIDIAAVVIYFIYCQIGSIKDGKRVTIAFEIYLLFNLFLVALAFLLMLRFAASPDSVPTWYPSLLGSFIGISELLGLGFIFYPFLIYLYDK